MLVLLLARACAAEAYTNLFNVVKGSWTIDVSSFQPGSKEKIEKSAYLVINATNKPQVLQGLYKCDDNIFEFTLSFSSKGVFVMHSLENEKIAEFEFIITMMPHMTSVGTWKQDAVYSAEIVSTTSMHLSIMNHDGTSSYLMFSKEIDRTPKSWFEQNLITFITTAFVIGKVAKREWNKHSAELLLKKKEAEEMKKLEEEEENEEE